MAVPTISSVSPASGPPGGGTVVRVDGTNFQLPPNPPPSGSGPVPVPPATVRAFFGGVEARRVRIASSSLLFLTTDRHDPGAVDLEVRNVGPYGETLGSEVATATGAFTYARPDFASGQSTLQLVTRTMIQELKRQVLPEVVLSQNVDWARDPSSVLRKVAIAKLPAVWLAGPTLRENRVYQQNERVFVDLVGGNGLKLVRRNGRTVDAVYGFGVVSNNPMEALEIASALTDFFQRNPWLYVPIDVGSTTQERFDMDLEQDLGMDLTPSEDNVLSGAGSCAIAGVDMGENVQITVESTVVDSPSWSSERVS